MKVQGKTEVRGLGEVGLLQGFLRTGQGLFSDSEGREGHTARFPQPALCREEWLVSPLYWSLPGHGPPDNGGHQQRQVRGIAALGLIVGDGSPRVTVTGSMYSLCAPRYDDE